MKIYNKTFQIPRPSSTYNWSSLVKNLADIPGADKINRIILTNVENDTLTFDSTFVESDRPFLYCSLLSTRIRTTKIADPFVVAHIIPTGIRTELGGFAGDATPITNLLASTCDYLVTNPNAVTASDLYFAKENVGYLEGNLICQLLLGNISIVREKRDRIAVIIEKPKQESFLNNVLNAINGMRAVGGLMIDPVIVTRSPIEAKCTYSPQGYASGEFSDLSGLKEALDMVENAGVNSVALVSSLLLEDDVRQAYFKGKEMPNPWGAAEAMLTHMITQLYPFTSAHAPLLTAWENAGMGKLVDPRDGAELISTAYVCSPIEGLKHSPRPVKWQPAHEFNNQYISVENISALVLPASAIGNIPFFVSLDQKIPVILVKDNKNVMDVTIERLNIDLKQNRIHMVNSYAEAAGLLTALREGIAIETLQRPLLPVAPMVL